MAYENMDAVQIGSRIRTLREGQNLSHESLANGLGVSMSAVAMYETGKRIPRDEIKIRIADYFHVPVESIFFPVKQHETCD